MSNEFILEIGCHSLSLPGSQRIFLKSGKKNFQLGHQVLMCCSWAPPILEDKPARYYNVISVNIMWLCSGIVLKTWPGLGRLAVSTASALVTLEKVS